MRLVTTMAMKLGVPLILAACAGPMSPFGAKTLPPMVASSALIEASEQLTQAPGRSIASVPAAGEGASIEFWPNYRMHHASQNLSVTIYDPLGVTVGHELKFLYGDEDVTALWQRYAHKEFKDDGKTLTLTMAKIRFLAGLDKRFVVAYRQNHNSAYTIAKLQRPICPLYELAGIRNPEAFAKSRHIIGAIERESIKEGINPNLLAGLVAQESGYNPRAVSIARAIGLTQVTDAASEHVRHKIENAVSFRGIEQMSYPEIMMRIYSGEINASNEWRLNPKQSIVGGLHYLNFLREYWKSENSARQLAEVFKEHIPWEDIILASYNSGPYRVKTSLQSHGKNWIYHPKLKEARKYISKVRSYCHSFSQTNEVAYER